jgi:hypothetical protein
MNAVVKSILWLFPYELRRSIYRHMQPGHFQKLQQRRIIASPEGYSYKPFDQNRCIFVHIPKTAGISVCKSLFGNLAGGHTPLHSYQLIFKKYEFDNYFKFTFVRNPWDRLVSAYHYLRSGGISKSDIQWKEKNLLKFDDFNKFVLYGIKQKKIKKYRHFRPQYEYICEPGSKQPKVDFLGFYENLVNDFHYIMSELGISTKLKKANTGHSNRILDYKEYYTPETKKIVNDVYKTDIEIFGYVFDNSSLANQLKYRIQR